MSNPNGVKKYLIHVIEDDLDQADTLIYHLRQDGRFEVIHSENGVQAIGVHEGGVRPTLAICDVNLEEEGVGFSVVQDCTNRGIPAIVVTGRTTEDLDQLLAATHGSLHYLQKPYQVTVLIHTIENLLRLLGVMLRGVQLTPRLFFDPFQGVLTLDGEIAAEFSRLNSKVLNALINPGYKYCSLRILIVSVYGEYEPALKSNMRKQIEKVRKTLQKSGVPLWIETDLGRDSRGYRLVFEELESNNANE